MRGVVVAVNMGVKAVVAVGVMVVTTVGDSSVDVSGGLIRVEVACRRGETRGGPEGDLGGAHDGQWRSARVASSLSLVASVVHVLSRHCVSARVTTIGVIGDSSFRGRLESRTEMSRKLLLLLRLLLGLVELARGHRESI